MNHRVSEAHCGRILWRSLERLWLHEKDRCHSFGHRRAALSGEHRDLPAQMTLVSGENSGTCEIQMDLVDLAERLD